MKTLLIVAIIHTLYGQQRRYVIDNDSDLKKYAAFPIDICFKSRVVDDIYLKYTCSGDGNSVTKTEYGDAVCTEQTATTPTTWQSSTTSPCNTPKFSCTGSDEYVSTSLYPADDVCSGQGSLSSSFNAEIPTVIGCYCDDTGTSYQASCTNAGSGDITTYTTNTACSGTNSFQDLSICYVAASNVPAPLVGSVDVYAKISGCVLSTDTDQPSISPTEITVNPSIAPSIPTAGPTLPAPTSSPSSPTASSITYNSKFIIDNDWILAQNYPFPIGICLQTSPKLTTLISLNATFVYYECNSDTITKYKWTTKEVPSIDNDFECKINNELVSTTNMEIINRDSSRTTTCDTYYFNCNGQDNYATVDIKANIFGSFSNEKDCDNAMDLITTSIATQVCVCDSQLQISSKMICDGSDVKAYNYSGITCSDTSPDIEILGKANECIFFRTESIDFDDTTLTPDIYGNMASCIDNGEQATPDPTAATSNPSTAPTPNPTKKTKKNEPTQDIFSDNASLLNIYITYIVVILLFFF